MDKHGQTVTLTEPLPPREGCTHEGTISWQPVPFWYMCRGCGRTWLPSMFQTRSSVPLIPRKVKPKKGWFK